MWIPKIRMNFLRYIVRKGGVEFLGIIRLFLVAVYDWVYSLIAFSALLWFRLDLSIWVRIFLVISTFLIGWVIWYIGYKVIHKNDR